jgi:hypothetical protein
MNRLLAIFAPMLMAGAISLASPSNGNADDLLAGLPALPDSTALGTGTASSGGQMARYSTPAAPGAVIASYQKSLPAAGWTVTGAGGSGSSNGGGAGLQATSGPKYLSISAGGPQGTTFVSVCVWPAKPKNDHCGDSDD